MSRRLQKELRVRAVPGQLERVQTFLEDTLSEAGFPLKNRQLGAVAAEEVFINICSYSGSQEAVVAVEADGPGVRVTFTDTGRPFNPLTGEAPDLTLPAEERPIGGLGIHMVRTIADTVSYSRVENHNVLELIFQRKGKER